MLATVTDAWLSSTASAAAGVTASTTCITCTNQSHQLVHIQLKYAAPNPGKSLIYKVTQLATAKGGHKTWANKHY